MLNLYALMLALEEFTSDYLRETKVNNLTLEDILMILKKYHESLDFIKEQRTLQEVENDSELFKTVE